MVARGHCRQITYQFLLVVGASDGVTGGGGRTFDKGGEACSNPRGARSASLQWGSEGTAPSGAQRQSPWSGGKAPEAESFLALADPKEGSNLHHFCLLTAL